MKFSRQDFELFVKEGIEKIPEKFLNLLNNVDIVIEDEPTPAQRRKMRLRPDMTLFGLYEGVPQSKRGPGYSFVLPDKITIFERPIEDAARSVDELKRIVRDTVWHEIAHHFGMEEARVRLAEKKRRSARHQGSVD